MANISKIKLPNGSTYDLKTITDTAITAGSTNPVTSAAIYSSQHEQDVLLANLVDAGAKNSANWSEQSSTINGVTFTNNGDGTISTSGTASQRAQKTLYLIGTGKFLPGRYVLSGCPEGGEPASTTKYCLYVWDVTSDTRVSMNDVGSGIAFDWTPDNTHTYAITVDIRNGVSADGLTFRPMICTAEDWAASHKFAPYCPTMAELYEMIMALQNMS